MSDFSINGFGSLTNKAGKEFKIDLNEVKKFDADGDTRITEEELNNYVKSLNDDFDSTEINKLFQALDKDATADVDNDEFAVYDQKIKMQEAVNAKLAEIAADTKLSSKAANIRDELKGFIDTFANQYTGDAAKMSEEFPDALDKKLEEIKAEIKANDPETLQEKVLEQFEDILGATTKRRASLFRKAVEVPQIPDTAKKRLLNILESESDKFRASYDGNNFEADLSAHLSQYLSETDTHKMSDAIVKFDKKATGYGDYVSNNELKSLKEDVTEFLQEAIKQGVTITLGGTKVKTEAGIKAALAKFTDGSELIQAVRDEIGNLSAEMLKDRIIAEEKEKAEAAELKKFTDIKGEEYKVNASLIDYSKVDSRYFEENGQIHERGKGWSGSRDRAYNTGYAILAKDEMKSQIEAQIQSMLSAKGVSYDKVKDVVENIYNQTIDSVLNADGMITGRGARGFSSKGHAYINVKNLCDTFITQFNANIANAINDMNKSQDDLDIVDLDYNANIDEEVQEQVDKLKNYSKRGLFSSYFDKKAKELETPAKLDALKPQLFLKAKAMCDKNGITFDNTVFDTIFNNSRAAANVSESNNPQLILAQNFKTNFTTWVESEKAKKQS